MVRKCFSCGAPLSDYVDKCPKCRAAQKDPTLVRKAGRVFKRRNSHFSAKQVQYRFGL